MAPNGLLVYLSGPITSKDGVSVEENVAAALKVFLMCVELGIPAICPQLTGAFPSAWSEVSYEQWMVHDFGVIERCSHVLLLPRWETSAGAQREKAYAESIGVPVVTSFDALRAVHV